MNDFESFKIIKNALCLVVCLFDVFVRSMLLSSNPSRCRRPCLICFPIPRVKVNICMTEDKSEKLTYLQYVMYILPTVLSDSCFDLLRRTNTCAKHIHTQDSDTDCSWLSLFLDFFGNKRCKRTSVPKHLPTNTTQG